MTPTILFNTSKGETHHPKSHLSKLYRRLREHGKKCRVNKGSLSLDSIKEASVLVFGGPQDPFSAEDISNLQDFVASGGAIAFFLNNDGLLSLGSDLASLLNGIGITVNKDCVVSLAYNSKSLHPRHVHITDGTLHDDAAADVQSFVYPNGSTLMIESPSVAILSSGTDAFPNNVSVAAAWEQDGQGQGRVIVVGSADMFANDFLDGNGKLCDVLFRFLLHDGGIRFACSRTFNTRSVNDEDDDDNKCFPDIATLAQRVKPSLDELDPLPQDLTRLFCDDLFGFDTSLVPEMIHLYEELDVRREPLCLIPPEFECPMPPLRPAVFTPHMTDLPMPALDKFNLDDCFADRETKLAQLTNQCADEGDAALEKNVKKAGHILDLTTANDKSNDGKRVLSIVFSKIAQYKQCSHVF